MGFQFERIYKGTQDFPIGIFSQTQYLSESHHHIEYELFYLDEGEALCGIESNEFKISSKSCIFFESGINHYVTRISPDAPFKYYAIVFNSSIFGSEQDPTRAIFENIIIKQNLSLNENILKMIKKIVSDQENKKFGTEVLLKNLIYEIFVHILNTNQYVELPKSYVTQKNKNNSLRSIDAGIAFIKTHYRETITLEDILKSTNYSRSHFIRLFKASTGMNYTDYLNKYRIEKSCVDLIYTNKNITEVAMENGFNNIQYFSKIFKKYMNCTPKQYQKKGSAILIPSNVTKVM